MHPEKVKAIAAGGVNGILTFPLESWKTEELAYPVGITDLTELTGIEFNKRDYAEIRQFIYMGSLDSNDSIPYPDSFNDNERELIYRLFGRTMLPDRWEKTQAIYTELGLPVRFKTYDGIDHRYSSEIIDDIILFFNEILQG